MAKPKPKSKPLPEQQVWVPRRVDAHAVEVCKGQVVVEGLGDQSIPLQDYLLRKQEQLEYLEVRQRDLYTKCREFIKINLPLRGAQWQEECRQLSWAYSQQQNSQHLRKIESLCPSMPLGLPQESVVQTHHLSHFIKAFLATVLQLAPTTSGHSSCIVCIAEEEEVALQSRIIVWEYLLTLVPQERKLSLERKKTELQVLIEKVDLITKQLNQLEQTIKEVLCQTSQQPTQLVPLPHPLPLVPSQTTTE